jgi:hypothetical protein
MEEEQADSIVVEEGLIVKEWRRSRLTV